MNVFVLPSPAVEPVNWKPEGHELPGPWVAGPVVENVKVPFCGFAFLMITILPGLSLFVSVQVTLSP